ncbi:MAG: hypothetical protein HQL23_07260 [Candidatus Omnitrophica bacterium]|nr:hypothetical protein [Candidatus Omnitrophota bacterium]
MDPDKIIRSFIYGVAIVFVLRFLFFSGLFKSDTYAGDGFTFKPPLGWAQIKDDKELGIFVKNKTTEIATFVSPLKNLKTGEPLAKLTVASVRLDAPNWIEDMFPDILQSVSQTASKLIDQGEIKIGEPIFKWVMFKDAETKRNILEFYATDEGNKMFKIRFSATGKGFNKYRQDFEAAKSTFTIKTGIF